MFEILKFSVSTPKRYILFKEQFNELKKKYKVDPYIIDFLDSIPNCRKSMRDIVLNLKIPRSILDPDLCFHPEVFHQGRQYYQFWLGIKIMSCIFSYYLFRYELHIIILVLRYMTFKKKLTFFI